MNSTTRDKGWISCLITRQCLLLKDYLILLRFKTMIQRQLPQILHQATIVIPSLQLGNI